MSKMKALHLTLLYEWRYSIWGSVPHWKAELRVKRKSTPPLSPPPKLLFQVSTSPRRRSKRNVRGLTVEMTAASSLEKAGPGIQPKALAGLGDACSAVLFVRLVSAKLSAVRESLQ